MRAAKLAGMGAQATWIGGGGELRERVRAAFGPGWQVSAIASEHQLAGPAPDVILLDACTPGGDWAHTVAYLRADLRLFEVPIIVVIPPTWRAMRRYLRLHGLTLVPSSELGELEALARGVIWSEAAASAA